MTGAGSGIGTETARVLAARGARVVLACRDIEKARPVAAELGARAELRRLDLSDLGSVREFAANCEPVDTVIANAGVSTIPKRLTADGIELQFATNHLGHFALITALLGRIRDRVVVVSSMTYRFTGLLHLGRLDYDDPAFERRSYSPFGAYCQSKLANLLFVRELRNRLADSGSSVRALAVHPGICRTTAGMHTGTRSGDIAWELITRAVGQDADRGAWPSLYAATAAGLTSGSYYGPGGFLGMTGPPVRTRLARAARDDRRAAELWRRSEQLLHEHRSLH